LSALYIDKELKTEIPYTIFWGNLYQAPGRWKINIKTPASPEKKTMRKTPMEKINEFRLDPNFVLSIQKVFTVCINHAATIPPMVIAN
jgi:hypothetical protein